MSNPIVVWPPGTFWLNCGQFDNPGQGDFYYDCSQSYPEFQANGALGACCPMGW
jgi:hypothetical protein